MLCELSKKCIYKELKFLKQKKSFYFTSGIGDEFKWFSIPKLDKAIFRT